MNYLAHIYLSPDHELIRIGNFMADHIKGNSYLSYPDDVQKGILLHRQIDSFTDAHDMVRKSKRRLDDEFGLYRGIIIDIFYDHMLAKNWNLYAKIPLEEYTRTFYGSLRKHWEVLPDKVRHMSKYLIRDNWLLSYADIDGIKSVLEGMNRRTGGKSQMNRAIQDLEQYYDDFDRDFKIFFKELTYFSESKILEINKLYDPS